MPRRRRRPRVKGVNFVDLRDAGDPVELAARYDAEGADELVFLDITASSDARDTIIDVVRRTAEQVFIPFTVGGGIRTVDDARRLLRAGADKVSVNTAAVDRPELISEIAAEFGAQCVVVAIDARRAPGPTHRQRVRGVHPRRPHADRHRRRRVGGIAPRQLGAGEILLTSMDRDGTRDGFDLELTAAISDAVGIPVIASGGVGTLDHLVDGVLDGHADAVLAASIFHFGEHTVREAKRHMADAGHHRPARDASSTNRRMRFDRRSVCSRRRSGRPSRHVVDRGRSASRRSAARRHRAAAYWSCSGRRCAWGGDRAPPRIWIVGEHAQRRRDEEPRRATVERRVSATSAPNEQPAMHSGSAGEPRPRDVERRGEVVRARRRRHRASPVLAPTPRS